MRISRVLNHLIKAQSVGSNREEITGVESSHEFTDKEHQPETNQQQLLWTQSFEKLLEDPLGLRAFAVSTCICSEINVPVIRKTMY
jgi:hypothetical protein